MGTLQNIRRHAIKPGKLILVQMNMYPAIVVDGVAQVPGIWVEHLGDTNYGFMNASFRNAGDEGIAAIARRGAASPEDRGRVRTANRQTMITHSVRKLEWFFYDGENGEPDLSKPVPNTAEGIADIVNALDDIAFDLLLTIAVNPENFRDKPIGTAGDIAKK